MTEDELIDAVLRIVRAEVPEDELARIVDLSAVDRDRILLSTAIAALEQFRVWKRHAAERRARRLFVTFLDADQRAQYRRKQYVDIVGSSGGHYRLYPRGGGIAQVEQHGQRWYGRVTFCIHDPGRTIPAADLSLSHLLLIVANESEFVATANATTRTLWDGDWRRQLNRARRERQAAIAVAVANSEPQTRRDDRTLSIVDVVHGYCVAMNLARSDATPSELIGTQEQPLEPPESGQRYDSTCFENARETRGAQV